MRDSACVDFASTFLPEELLEWEPPEKLGVSEWADKKRVLDGATSPEPGPWRTDRTPYLQSVMDAFNDPEVEEVIVQTSTQVGKTEVLLNVLGYLIDQRPGPTMVVYPTVDVGEDISRTRIQPMIDSHGSLKRKKLLDRHRFTTLRMQFIGMDLFISGANSASSLASKPCEFLLFDEVNKYPSVIGDEADPISLGVERTKNFPFSRKIFMVSTPTTQQGRITMELESCDAVFDYHVPCPFCDGLQPLKFSQVKWPEMPREDPQRLKVIEEEAYYECELCQKRIFDHHKPEMLRKGEWRSGNPSVRRKKIGFRLSSLYSPWVKFGQMAVQFLKSKPFPEKLQNFVNSWLGEPWMLRISGVMESDVLKAKTELPPQTVPEDAVVLTAAIDCQKHGFWFVVRAWARDYSSWLIHYGQLVSWEDVEGLLFETEYPHAEGSSHMGIWRAAVDTGGGDLDHGTSMTEEVYWWLRRNGTGRGCRVWGTKGSSSPLRGKVHLGKPLDRTPSGKPIPGGLQLVMLDTDRLKDAFFYRLDLAREGQPMGAYLHSGVDSVYTSHLSAEEKQRDRKGVEKWVRIRRRNDLLDCECMNLALADPEWPGGGVHLIRSSPEPSGRNVRVAKSRWMGS